MHNPAWNHPGLDRSQLRPELNADEVATLQWQVALAKERAGLRDTVINAEDRHVLIGVVLPAMVRHLRNTGPVGFMVRLFRGISPAAVQKWFTKAMNKTGSALLFLLDNTFLSSIAFIVTKALRTLVCYAALGIQREQLDILRELAIKSIDPERHHPILSAVVRIVVASSQCVVAGLTGSIGLCIGKSFNLSTTVLPRAVLNWETNVTSDVFEYLGGPLAMMGRSIQNISTVYGQDGLITGAGYTLNEVWYSIFGGIAMSASEVDAIEKKREELRLSGMTGDLINDFKTFHTSFTYAVTGGILLWVARYINIEEVFRWLSVVSRLIPGVDAVVASLETVVTAVRKVNPAEFVSLHRCILFIIEFPGMLRNIGTVIETVHTLISLFRCGSVVLAGIIRRILGIPGFENLNRDADCCTQTLIG